MDMLRVPGANQEAATGQGALGLSTPQCPSFSNRPRVSWREPHGCQEPDNAPSPK